MVNICAFMKQAITLFAPVSPEKRALLFEKVIGFPLLLRNILALYKMGFRNTLIVLPKENHPQYESEIAPELKKRKIEVSLLEKTPEENQKAIDANVLIEEKKGALFYELVVDSPSKIKRAEKKLLENIRLSALGPVARHLNKRISLPISLRLARRRLHPNWVSFFNILIGLSTGFFVAQGSYGGGLLGGFLFQMASVFDGCDGELAKLTFKTNKMGEYLDSISDNGALLSFFGGLVIAFAKSHETLQTIGLGLFLLAGLAALFFQIIVFLKKHTHSASLATFDREYLSKLPSESPLFRFLQTGKILMRKDAFSMLFFVLALCGVIQWVLTIAIIGTWVANVLLLLIKQRAWLATKESTPYEG